MPLIYSFILAAIYYGTHDAIDFAYKMLNQFILSKNTTNKFYLGGDGVQVLSNRWLTFLFGFLSQQHFFSDFSTTKTVKTILKFGYIIGPIVLVVGAFAMLKVQFSTIKMSRQNKLYLSMYILILLIVVLQYFIGKATYYTQAKGAQNVLIYVYLLMILPLAMLNTAMKEGMKVRFLANFLKIMLVCFIFILFIIRIPYTVRLAFGLDRGVILEPSFFSESNKILQQDRNAYVLIEPRKSADTYLVNQTFFGRKIIITKNLVLQVYITPFVDSFKQILGSDLINSNDIPHLWIMYANCKSNQMNNDCHWESHKISEYQKPVLFLFANDYEKNFLSQFLYSHSKNIGVFSLVNNGSAVIFMPSTGGTVEVTIQPKEKKDYDKIFTEILDYIHMSELHKYVNLSRQNDSFILRYSFPQTNSSSLYTLVRLKENYLINVRSNNQDLI